MSDLTAATHPDVAACAVDGRSPTAIAVRRLNHAVLFISDLARSVDFYGRVLGMREIARVPNAAFLRAAGSPNHHDLGLFGLGPRATPAPRGALGLYHLAWQVDTIDELAAARELLFAEGAHRGESSHGATKSLYGADPDGHEFEIMWMLPREAWGDYDSSAPVDPLDALRGRPVERGEHRMTACSAAPVVSLWGSENPAAPLVVLLHGRGANEADMAGLRRFLPSGAAYAAVRGPLAEPRGRYAWFANRGIGRPLADSLAATMSWFRAWLDEHAPPGRPVVPLGFSGGAAFAGGLLLSDPARFAAGVVLYGTLPFDAGVPVTAGRLAGVPIFLAHGDHDTVIPPELQGRTWEYLVKQSGSPLWAERVPNGHELTPKTASEVGTWLAERFAFIRHHGAAPAGPVDEPVHWPTLPGGELPRRAGEPPDVSVTTPQQQESQNAPPPLQEALHARLAELDGVMTAPSVISVPGARAFTLAPPDAAGPDDAFIVPAVREFAHLHPAYDGSLHLTLPIALAYDVVAKGWGVAHPLAGIRLTPGMVMLFGPRDQAELGVVTGVVAASHAYAHGASRG